MLDLGYTISTPAGHCPVPLRSADPDAVVAWADRVRSHYDDRGQRIAASGLVYHAREFFPYPTQEYRDIRALLLLAEESPERPVAPETIAPPVPPPQPKQANAPEELLATFVDRLVAGEPRRRLAAELHGLGFAVPVTRLYNLGVARRLQLAGG